MKELKKNLRVITAIVLCAFIGLGVYFSYTVYINGSRWLINANNPRLRSMKKKVVPGNILDRNGVILAGVDSDGARVYHSSSSMRRAVSQTVGDTQAMAGTGVETFHAGYLLGFTSNIFDRTWQMLSGKQIQGDNVWLTIDADLTKYISQTFPDGKDGAAVIMNYKTGAIYSMVSKPDFDPNKVLKRTTSNIDDSAFLNRVTQGQYTPGSIFKLITTAAALESLPNAQTRIFNCLGELAYGEGMVRDAGGATGHGDINLKEAFLKSCNVTYSWIGFEMGESKLAAKAKAMGFDTNFLFKDIVLYQSKYPTPTKDDHELAWSAVGQGRVTVTPLHMCMIAGSIANGGQMMEPQLISQVTGVGGIPKPRALTGVFMSTMSQGVASIIKEYMLETVVSGTGKRAAVKNYKVAGKTGTAEVSDDKNVKPHSWFIGFVDDPSHPLAIAVVVEKAGNGSEVAAPLVSKFLNKAISLGY